MPESPTKTAKNDEATKVIENALNVVVGDLAESSPELKKARDAVVAGDKTKLDTLAQRVGVAPHMPTLTTTVQPAAPTQVPETQRQVNIAPATSANRATSPSPQVSPAQPASTPAQAKNSAESLDAFLEGKKKAKGQELTTFETIIAAVEYAFQKTTGFLGDAFKRMSESIQGFFRKKKDTTQLTPSKSAEKDQANVPAASPTTGKSSQGTTNSAPKTTNNSTSTAQTTAQNTQPGTRVDVSVVKNTTAPKEDSNLPNLRDGTITIAGKRVQLDSAKSFPKLSTEFPLLVIDGKRFYGTRFGQSASGIRVAVTKVEEYPSEFRFFARNGSVQIFAKKDIESVINQLSDPNTKFPCNLKIPRTCYDGDTKELVVPDKVKNVGLDLEVTIIKPPR